MVEQTLHTFQRDEADVIFQALAQRDSKEDGFLVSFSKDVVLPQSHGGHREDHGGPKSIDQMKGLDKILSLKAHL